MLKALVHSEWYNISCCSPALQMCVLDIQWTGGIVLRWTESAFSYSKNIQTYSRSFRIPGGRQAVGSHLDAFQSPRISLAAERIGGVDQFLLPVFLLPNNRPGHSPAGTLIGTKMGDFDCWPSRLWPGPWFWSCLAIRPAVSPTAWPRASSSLPPRRPAWFCTAVPSAPSCKHGFSLQLLWSITVIITC